MSKKLQQVTAKPQMQEENLQNTDTTTATLEAAFVQTFEMYLRQNALSRHTPLPRWAMW